ncbi:MAG: hypothetical protein AAFY00_12085, partial [Bacteroidota bacterium]
MGKKNLEQLFKDTFQDFHETPDDKVWKSIEATLDKKKNKKRVIPIWWQLGGVAALFAILFFAINPLDSSNETDTDNPNQVVGTESQEEIVPKANDSIKNSTQITEASEQQESFEKEDEDFQNFNAEDSNTTKLANSNEPAKGSNLNEEKESSDSKKRLETAVAQNDKTSPKTDSENSINQILEDSKNNTQNVVVAVEKETQEEKGLDVLKKNEKEVSSGQEIEVAQTDIENKKEEELSEKQSIYDAIAE